jgi:hypothetical protein
MDEALADYERLRDAATATDYQLNVQLARFELAPEMALVRTAVRGDQEAINQYFMMTQGVLPRDRFLESERSGGCWRRPKRRRKGSRTY